MADLDEERAMTKTEMVIKATEAAVLEYRQSGRAWPPDIKDDASHDEIRAGVRRKMAEWLTASKSAE